MRHAARADSRTKMEKLFVREYKASTFLMEGGIMENQFSRTRLLLGQDKMDALAKAKVAVFGIGGVGGHAAEALARSGVGAFLLVDKDQISETNINRQIIATNSTVGKDKVEVMRERILDIHPEARVEIQKRFFLPENAEEFDFIEYSYIVDAVDTVTAKLALIMRAQACNVPIISSMGAGNKLDPTLFQVADIYETSMCPLAKVMRRELKKRGVEKLKVVYSTEKPIKPVLEAPYDGVEMNAQSEGKEKTVPGSVAFVPSVAGLIIAAEVVKDLTAGC